MTTFLYVLSRNLYQLRSPFYSPILKKNKIFEPVSPGSSSKYYALSFLLLPLHFSKKKSVLAASRSSPHIHSSSHSHLASVSTPPLKLPSPSHQRPSNPVSGLTLLVLSSNKHSPPSTNSSHSWLPRLILSPTSLLLLRCLSQLFWLHISEFL